MVSVSGQSAQLPQSTQPVSGFGDALTVASAGSAITGYNFSPEVNAAILDRAAHWGLDPQALAAIVMIESSGRPGAVNDSTGASGLMQLKPETFREFFPRGNIFNMHQNIDAAMMDMQKNAFPILRELGIDPKTLTAVEIYGIHQQGRAGGPAAVAAARGITLENVPVSGGGTRNITPGSPIAEVVAGGVSLVRADYNGPPETPAQAAVRVNRNIEPLNFVHKDGRAGNAHNMTAAQFLEAWADRMGQSANASLFLENSRLFAGG